MRISDWSSDVCSSDLWISTISCVIEAFIDAIWAESGLAQQSLDSYRRDLEGYARWRDGAQGGLAGADRAGLFEYLARSAERRGGNEGVSTGSYWWWPCHEKKKNNLIE